MNSSSHLTVALDTNPEQIARLQALQAAFAEACNALAPVVREQRCWNRVTLHHLAYRALRERFPQLGSQMVCNVIYSVCRASRLVYQHPESPFNIQKRPDAPLPLLKFTADAPVYFDRHTLSLKDGTLSMYTLDGRMRFQIGLREEDQARFGREKLREITLSRNVQGYQLTFSFLSIENETLTGPETAPEAELRDTEGEEANAARVTNATNASARIANPRIEQPQFLLVLPKYLLVQPAEASLA